MSNREDFDVIKGFAEKMLVGVDLAAESEESVDFWDLIETTTDLSYLTESEELKCPKCNTEIENDEEYIVDGEHYPIIFNFKKGYNANGEYKTWDEVHCCKKCKEVFRVRNGD